MPSIEPQGTPVARDGNQVLTDLIAALKTRFGPGVTNPANPISLFAEAIVAMGIDELEQDALDVLAELDPRSNNGQNTESSFYPVFTLGQEKSATGVVELNYVTLPTSPTPLFSIGDIEFKDGSGARFVLTANVDPPTTIVDQSANTGTASETIGGVNTKIAQKFAITDDDDFPQFVTLKASAAATVTVRIETDSAGLPSGVLANSRLTKTGVLLNAGSDTVIPFALGARPGVGTFWVVVQPTSGTATFDGATTGTANQVRYFTGGSWLLSATVENLKMSLHRGGEAFVRAAVQGSAGNIAAGDIALFVPNTTPAQTQWTALGPPTFENLQGFVGGADRETSAELRERVRNSRAARNTGSINGLVRGIRDEVLGVTSVDGVENDTNEWLSDEGVFDGSTYTGTSSDTIASAGPKTKIAQRIVIIGKRTGVAFAIDLVTDTSSTITATLETDSSDEPSGALAYPDATKTGFVPGGTSRVTGAFNDGGFLEAGTYWLVLEATAGSFIVDGETTTGDQAVQYYDGSWNTSALVDNIRVELVGGAPPHSFHVWVEGGQPDDIAQFLMERKTAGAYSYGPVFGTAIDVGGFEKDVFYDEPLLVPVVFDIELTTNDDFTGSEQLVKDVLTEYVNGGGGRNGLLVSEELNRFLAMSLYAPSSNPDPRVFGVTGITTFRLGRKASFPTPGALTGAEVISLTASRGERFVISNDDDIGVTLA